MKDVPALDIKDLHKTFGQNEVLKGISLSAHKGDVVSIIGSSGSGKSTFLRCINLLETPTAGEIWVNGELIQMKNNRQGVSVPANEKQVQRIRSRLAMVFQGFNLWSHLTVLENVIEAPVHVLGVPKAQAIENAELLLKKVGLYERKDYYPGHLSGGQQQRAAIARALAVDPEVMLFDEP
ncbi:ATP-binding cassette domain-containing protein, partial [Vibrio sp. 10N.261.52.A1]